MVLAGNKCDMEEERVVSVDNGRLLAEQLGGSQSNIQHLVFFLNWVASQSVFCRKTFVCFVQTVKVCSKQTNIHLVIINRSFLHSDPKVSSFLRQAPRTTST